MYVGVCTCVQGAFKFRGKKKQITRGKLSHSHSFRLFTVDSFLLSKLSQSERMKKSQRNEDGEEGKEEERVNIRLQAV